MGTLGIVYCDVKPDNILISQRDEAKLTDFGLARPLSSSDRLVMVGTPGFFAPELKEISPEISYGTGFGSVTATCTFGTPRNTWVAPGWTGKVDTYSFGVTLQLVLLGEDAGRKAEIRG